MRKPWLALAAVALCAQDRPPIPAAAHMAYYVSDVAKARSWWEDFLGFQEAFVIKNAGGADRVIFIKINDRQFVELYAEPAKNHGLLHDVAFQTDDIRKLKMMLAARGVKVPDAIGKDPAGDLAFEISDPFGFTVQFVEYAPDSWTARTKGKFMPESRISTHIDHVGVLTNDKDVAAKFYGGVLGFAGEGSKLDIGVAGDRFEIGFERRPATPDRFHIKNHICVSAPDVPRMAEALKAKAIYKNFREIETHRLDNGKGVAELYDPDGNRVEVMEPGKEK